MRPRARAIAHKRRQTPLITFPSFLPFPCDTRWEAAKSAWDPDSSTGNDKVIVGGLAPLCDLFGGAKAMTDRVAAFNEARGLAGDAALVYRPRSFSLVLPAGVVRAFFDKCTNALCAHMQKLLIDAAVMRKPVGLVFLVGGFAESVYLQRCVQAALKTDGGGVAATLVVPMKPVQCVNRGAAMWGLYPSSFITSRVAKYTIAVALCELYDPAVHDPVPHPSYMVHTARGTYVDNVMVPLVQKNDEVGSTEARTTKADPLRDGQTTVSFRLYGLDRRLPPLTDDTPRSYLITERVAGGVPESALEQHVPASATVGSVTVNTGGGPARTSMCTLSLFFGRTEIRAQATATATGERKQVAISWEGAGARARAPARAPAPAAAPPTAAFLAT